MPTLTDNTYPSTEYLVEINIMGNDWYSLSMIILYTLRTW